MIFRGALPLSPSDRYSKKLKNAILTPHHVGTFSFEEAARRKVRFAKGEEGSIQEGNAVIFYWHVDPEDGVILDACFQAFGHPALLGAAEAACTLLIRKTYEQARFLSADDIDKALRDKPHLPAFPEETYSHVNLVLFAIEEAALTCMDIPLAEGIPFSPFDSETLEATPHPHWENLTTLEKRALIEEQLDEHIRPYVALDGGGVRVTAFNNDREIVITYEGNCTSCFAATGSTLSAIQNILQAKLHPSLAVSPDESVLTPQHFEMEGQK